MLSMISIEELKFIGPRIFLYAGMAYAATQLVQFGIKQTSKILGVKETK